MRPANLRKEALAPNDGVAGGSLHDHALPVARGEIPVEILRGCGLSELAPVSVTSRVLPWRWGPYIRLGKCLRNREQHAFDNFVTSHASERSGKPLVEIPRDDPPEFV